MSRKLSLRYVNGGLGSDINPSIHSRGYKLWRTGVQPIHIRKQLKITAKQLEWLIEVGSVKMPSYQSMVIEDVENIRSCAMESGLELGRIGSEAITARANNALKANNLLGGFLERMAARLYSSQIDSEEGDKKSKKPKFEDFLPSKLELDTIRVLDKLGDMKSTAEAFEKVFGDVAMNKALYPERDSPLASERAGNPLIALQGKEADRQRIISDDQMDMINEELMNASDEELEELQ